MLLLTTFALPAAPEPHVELSAPRDYGFFLGDLIEHTLTVTVPESYTLETGFLPKPGTLDEWLEVRSVNWDEHRANGEARYRIRVIYQLFKGVHSPEKAVVPALPLRFAGAEPLEAKAPAWEFTVTPLIPPQLEDENVAIRDSLPPAPVAMAPHRHRLLAYLAGALAVLGYLAWQKLGWTRYARPFARTRRELRKLLRSPASPESFRAAVKLLHRALDETAGGTLFAGQVDRFCASEPAFAEVREELTEFFALSQRLFFTAPEAPVPPDYPAARLEDLCRRCAAAERRTP
jgi:mxaA protein